MARSARTLEIDGEGAFWAVAGFAASLVAGVVLRPMRESAGLENVVVVYVIVVALTAALGGRAAGLASSLSAALACTWFFTTPYETLRIDSAEQVVTVALLFVAGLLASLGGRVTRRARVEAREEADVLTLLNAVSLAAARAGIKADVVAVDRLPPPGRGGPHPSGHHRAVGGTLVLPAEGAVIDLVRRGHRVGTPVIVPAEDRPILRATRLGIAATAHALANAR